MPPSYECEFSPDVWTKCTPKDFCSADDFKPNGYINYRIDYLQDESLDNWFTHLHLECKYLETQGQYPMSLFQISFISGSILGMLMFPGLSDTSGRKYIFFLGVLMHVMLVPCTFIVQEAEWFYCIVFFMGVE
jgi:MFS family permease